MLGYSLQTGQAFLRDFLADNSIDFKTFTVDSFREWLSKEIQRKERDLVFRKRCEMRDIRKEHLSILRSLNFTHRERKTSFEASPYAKRLEEIARERVGAERALEGLGNAVEKATGEKRAAMERKLVGFQSKLSALDEEETQILTQTPEKARLDEAELALNRYREDIGLVALEEEILLLNKEQARHTNRAGTRFEDVCRAFAEAEMLPQLKERGDSIEPGRIFILGGVTLGIAHTEIDNIIVRVADDPKEPVEVLAVVEAKRNINDVASGFFMRQQNLGFLTNNDTMYEPERYITKVFREGRFDKPAVHKEHDREFCFSVDSFRHFSPEQGVGYFVDRLYFVVQKRKLLGADSGFLSRIMHRVSTDANFDLNDDAYLRSLHQWILETLPPLQTRDVMEYYAQNEAWAKQFFVLERERES